MHIRPLRALGRGVAAISLTWWAACGSVAGTPADARPSDDAAIDATADAPDPPTDAGPDAPAPTGTVRELGTAGGRVTGGALVLDVQLGHPISQRPATAGAVVLGGGAAINP